MQTAEERYWLEQAEVDEWILALEAGEPPPSVPISGEWSTVKEVAARHRLHPKTIRKAIHEKRLKATAHGSGQQARYRIHRDAETAWIEGKGERKRATAARKAKVGTTFKDLVAK
jgi:excisionase family DNA binding protein